MPPFSAAAVAAAASRSGLFWLIGMTSLSSRTASAMSLERFPVGFREHVHHLHGRVLLRILRYFNNRCIDAGGLDLGDQLLGGPSACCVSGVAKYEVALARIGSRSSRPNRPPRRISPPRTPANQLDEGIGDRLCGLDRSKFYSLPYVRLRFGGRRYVRPIDLSSRFCQSRLARSFALTST